MNDSKVTVTISKTISIIQMIAGIALLCLFGLCTIMYVTDSQFAAEVGVGFIIVCMVFNALGILLVILSHRTHKLLKAFPTYVTAISNHSNGFIPDIAASLGVSESVVKKNIELMISRKYFPNAFFDRNANCIFLDKHAPRLNKMPSAVHRTAAETVTVKCKSCGGMNTLLRGQVGECEYCGSTIKGE